MRAGVPTSCGASELAVEPEDEEVVGSARLPGSPAPLLGLLALPIF